MRAKGFDEAALARIHAPIGLDIGAVSPAEIAVSIIGEIVASLRKKPLRAGERSGMKFGPTPLEEAEGAVLAHAVRVDGLALKKGDILTRERRLALGGGGRDKRVAARLEPGDVGENEAALKLAKRLAGAHLRARRRSPGGSTCSPKPRGLRSSTPTRSTGSTRSTRRSPSRPCRRTRGRRTATWSRRSRSFRLQLPVRRSRLRSRRWARRARSRSAIQADADRGRLDDCFRA